MPDLEHTVRQTLTARVSHLTDEQLSADRRPTPTAKSPHGPLRTFLLPAAAAVAVAGVVLAVLFTLNGGGKPHPTGGIAPSLVNTQWRLMSITQQGHTTTIPASINATLKLDDTGKARGNDGCNMFGTSVAINGSAIAFSGGDVTDILCADQVDTIERRYMTALAKVSQWSTSDGSLRLNGPDGLSLIFNAD